MSARSTTGFTANEVAEIVHDLVANIRRLQGEGDHRPWRELPENSWQRADTVRWVDLVRSNSKYSAREDHEAWRQRRLEQGWTYAPTRDDTRKQNPLLLPWEKLPYADRIRGIAGIELIRILLDTQ